jgi:hypothetical protein
LGWNAATLFGCHRARPLAHPGGAGLLWAIKGGKLGQRQWNGRDDQRGDKGEEVCNALRQRVATAYGWR